VARNAPPRPKTAACEGCPADAHAVSAQGEIDPIIAAITGAANQKAAAAEAAIKGYTDSYAHQLAGQDAGPRTPGRRRSRPPLTRRCGRR
jgi:hypothetical protein